MTTEVWIVHTRRQSDETSIFGVFSAKEKADDAALKWLDEHEHDDKPEDKMNFDPITKRYYTVVSYHAFVTKYLVE